MGSFDEIEKRRVVRAQKERKKIVIELLKKYGMEWNVRKYAQTKVIFYAIARAIYQIELR